MTCLPFLLSGINICKKYLLLLVQWGYSSITGRR
nr:MAG TPA: hypothetical protein [Caudoviricetes sp.]